MCLNSEPLGASEHNPTSRDGLDRTRIVCETNTRCHSRRSIRVSSKGSHETIGRIAVRASVSSETRLTGVRAKQHERKSPRCHTIPRPGRVSSRSVRAVPARVRRTRSRGPEGP